MLAASDPGMEAVWLESCRGSFAAMIADKQRREAAEAQSQAARSIAQPDELIDFVHLKVCAHRVWGGSGCARSTAQPNELMGLVHLKVCKT